MVLWMRKLHRSFCLLNLQTQVQTSSGREMSGYPRTQVYVERSSQSSSQQPFAFYQGTPQTRTYAS